MLELLPYRFDYGTSAEDAAKCVARVLAVPEGTITGDVSPEGVKLYERKPSWGNQGGGAPVFVGRFHTKPDGCTLVGRFRMSWDAVILMCAAFGYSAWRTIDTALSPEPREVYATGLQGIGFMLLLFVFFWISGTGARKRI